MSPAPESDSAAWHGAAHEKLTRILGQQEGERVLREALSEAGLAEIRSVDDLKLVANVLSRKSGFVALIGTVLRTYATLRAS